MSDKNEIIEKIKETGVLPVIRANSKAEARRVVDAVGEGGIKTIEVTMTVPNAVDLIAELTKDYGGELVVGAGTGLNAEAAAKCIDAGAQFIISPAADPETIRYCNEKSIVVMPGALTPTEIVAAWNAGADFVKIFPASALGGASYLKAIKAPLPHIKLIPTGGVSLATAAAFIKAGAEAVGVGGELVDLAAIRENRPEVLTERARDFLKIVREARKDQ